LSGVTIRSSTAADLPEIRDVFRRAALSNEGDRAWIAAHPDEFGLDEANVIDGRSRVAVVDGHIVGFATLVGSELEDLFVDPDWMRQGIATALVRNLASTVQRIDLTANPHALAFYESVGFIEDGMAETSGGPAVRMHRDCGDLWNDRNVPSAIGTQLVEAIGARDASAVAACFRPGAAIRALIPPGLREGSGADEVAALVVGWFADSTELELVDSRAEEVGDRLHVAYRFEGVEEGDSYIVEQHLFCTLVDGAIEAADLLCSGFRPRDRDEL
jgi:GNAT superfamily N-acetyltransferase